MKSTKSDESGLEAKLRSCQIIAMQAQTGAGVQREDLYDKVKTETEAQNGPDQSKIVMFMSIFTRGKAEKEKIRRIEGYFQKALDSSRELYNEVREAGNSAQEIHDQLKEDVEKSLETIKEFESTGAAAEEKMNAKGTEYETKERTYHAAAGDNTRFSPELDSLHTEFIELKNAFSKRRNAYNAAKRTIDANTRLRDAYQVIADELLDQSTQINREAEINRRAIAKFNQYINTTETDHEIVMSTLGCMMTHSRERNVGMIIENTIKYLEFTTQRGIGYNHALINLRINLKNEPNKLTAVVHDTMRALG